MGNGSSWRPHGRVYVPDRSSADSALARTTHLGIVAHADDLEILAYHGIVTCYRDPSLAFSGIVVTDGAGAVRALPHAHLSSEEFIRVRAEEQERAADRGRYAAVAFLNATSEETKQLGLAEIDERIGVLASRTRPRVVYTHSLFDRHGSHLAVALRTLRVLRALPEEMRPETVLGVEVWGDLDWLPEAMKVRLDVGGEPELEESLLRCFASQITAKRYDLAAIGRRVAHATFSESHEADATDRVCFATDLTPLLRDGAPEPAIYADQLLEGFRAETRARLERLLASG